MRARKLIGTTKSNKTHPELDTRTPDSKPARNRSPRVDRLLAALAAALCSSRALAQQVETSLPPSQRVTINLSSGMPGQSLGFAVRRRRRGLHWMMLLLPSIVVAVTLIAGCSKSSSTTNPTTGGTSTTSTVTVTATSGSLMHAATFSLTVTPTT
jgi:hypothetical protein